MGRSLVNIGLMANPTSRKLTFKKRSGGLMKKLQELTTLCGVQACAVLFSPYESNPVAWPSRGGVGEVFSEFMEIPMMERTNKMMNQESYTRQRINKEEEQLKKLRDENREFAIRELMLHCLKGKMMMEHYHYNPSVVQDLRSHIDSYLNELTCRIKILTENDEASSLPPFPLVAVADAAAVTMNQQEPVQYQDPAKFYGHIQHQNMSQQHLVQYQNVNQQNPVQFQDPAKFCGHTQHQNMNQQHPVQYQNVNQQNPVQFQDPAKFYGHTQHQNMNQQHPVQYQDPTDFFGLNKQRVYDTNSNQSMIHGLNHSLSQNSNQFPNQQEPLMDLLMGYAEEHASIPSMDDNPYRYYQLSAADLASTSHMPSTTTAASNSHMPSTTTAASTSNMPSTTTAASTSNMPSTTIATADLFAPDINDWF